MALSPFSQKKNKTTVRAMRVQLGGNRERGVGQKLKKGVDKIGEGVFRKIEEVRIPLPTMMVTYFDGLLPLKLNDPLIRRSY